MPLEFNGSTVNAVTFNGNTVNEVQFNGVTVWQASPAFFEYHVNYYWYPSGGSSVTGKQFLYSTSVTLPDGTVISSNSPNTRVSGSTDVNAGDTILFQARSYGTSGMEPIYGKRAVIYLNDVIVADVRNNTVSTSASARATYSLTVPAGLDSIICYEPSAGNDRVDGVSYHQTTLRITTRS